MQKRKSWLLKHFFIFKIFIPNQAKMFLGLVVIKKHKKNFQATKVCRKRKKKMFLTTSKKSLNVVCTNITSALSTLCVFDL